MLRDELKNISREHLLNTRQISVRAYNACGNGELYTVEDILSYYEQGNSFKTLRNAGWGTCLELEKFCQNIIPLINKPIIENKLKTEEDKELEKKIEEEKKNEREREIKELIENNLLFSITNNLIAPTDILNYLSQNKKDILTKRYKELAAIYSVRTKNRLIELGFEDFVTNYLFGSHDSLLKIQNFGQRSLNEGVDFKEKLKDEIYRLINLSEDDFIREQLIREKGECVQNDFVYDYYNQKHHLPMFWIIEQQLKSDKSRDIDIFINSYQIFENHKIQDLDDLGKKYGITRERARQVRNKIFEKVFYSDEIFFSHIGDWDYCKVLFNNANSIWQEDSQIQQLLKQERCDFSAKCVIQILSTIFNNTHKLYGGFEGIEKENFWKNIVLITKELSEVFDFQKLRDDIDNLISEPNDTDYSFDIEEYVSNCLCWKFYSLDKIEDVISIVKEILLYEFHLCPDLDGKIIIPANKIKHPSVVVYEILLSNGNPMHIYDIFKEFKIIQPEHKYTEPDQLRSYLQKHTAITYINRSSTFTLKEWSHIKTGTIRDAIVEYLSSKDIPQNDENIAKYVLQHFPQSNITSIRTTMYNDTKKRFSYFKDGLFGLSNKLYLGNYEKMEGFEIQRKNFDVRLYDLEKFIIENEHFPFSCSENKEEEALYRWWKLAIKGLKGLTEKQIAEVERIKTQYADCETDKNNYIWDVNYNKFKCFWIENNRIPFASGREKFLYGWWRRAKTDYLENKLNEEQRSRYIELCKMM